MAVSSLSEWKMKSCPSHPPRYVLVCSNTMESCSALWLLRKVLTVCLLEPGEGIEKNKDGILHPIVSFLSWPDFKYGCTVANTCGKWTLDIALWCGWEHDIWVSVLESFYWCSGWKPWLPHHVSAPNISSSPPYASDVLLPIKPCLSEAPFPLDPAFFFMIMGANGIIW